MSPDEPDEESHMDVYRMQEHSPDTHTTHHSEREVQCFIALSVWIKHYFFYDLLYPFFVVASNLVYGQFNINKYLKMSSDDGEAVVGMDGGNMKMNI